MLGRSSSAAHQISAERTKAPMNLKLHEPHHDQSPGDGQLLSLYSRVGAEPSLGSDRMTQGYGAEVAFVTDGATQFHLATKDLGIGFKSQTGRQPAGTRNTSLSGLTISKHSKSGSTRRASCIRITAPGRCRGGIRSSSMIARAELVSDVPSPSTNNGHTSTNSSALRREMRRFGDKRAERENLGPGRLRRSAEVSREAGGYRRFQRTKTR